MTEEIHKFTKIWFLVAAFVALTFSIAFFFLWDWFFVGIQQWPFNDTAMPLIFGGSVISFSVMNFLSFFKAKWSNVKIPLITMLVWAWSGVIIMLYIQFGIAGIHAWNWMNTVSYIIIGIGFIVALILELKARKTE